MNVSPTIPPEGNDPIYASAILPASGTYKIFVRLRNRVGNLSPISNAIDERFEIVASATGSLTSHPNWAGTLENCIVWPHDGENRIYTDPATVLTTIPFSDWDGEGDFPSGEQTGFGVANATTGAKTRYSTITKDFTTDGEGVKTREIYVALVVSTPEGKVATEPAGFEITLTVTPNNGAATTQIVEDGALTRYENVASVSAIINFHNQRNHALAGVTIGWRDIE